MIDESIDEVIRNYFFLRWLRPEDVAWDIAAYVLLSPILREKNSTVFEIGIGNGYRLRCSLMRKFKAATSASNG